MRRFVIFCWILAGSITALTLFQIKQEVIDLEDEIQALHRDILRDQEAIHVLQAEWSYLNNPGRIAALAERHLQLAPIPAERVIGFEDLPLPGQPEEAPEGPDEPSAVASQATLVTAPGRPLRGQLQ